MSVRKIDLRLDEDVLEDLLLLAKHAGQIEQIVNVAGQLPPGAGLVESAKHAARHVQLPVRDVERLLLILQNVLRTLMRTRIDAGQFLEAATHTFEEEADKPEGIEKLKTWKEAVDGIRQQLTKIDHDHPFAVARKAERLVRAHEHILYEGKVITDLRPVFSKAGDKILDSVITHTLLIDYFDGTRTTRIEIGLDDADVSDLRKVCERAELKAATLRRALKGMEWACHLQDGERLG